MLAIGEIAKRSNVPATTLRYYEKVGLLPQVDRNSGQRRYSPEIVQRIRFIKMAQQAGFQVHEIFTLLEGFDSNIPPSERWREMAQSKRRELAERSKQIVMMQMVLENGLKCSCLSWDDCFVHVNVDGNCCKGV